MDRKHLDAQEGSVRCQGELLDLSECGVGLSLRFAVSPGAMLFVGPMAGNALALPPAQVVRCVPLGGAWRHGCALGRRLTPEEVEDWLK
jgi:hypothetical protein